MSEQRRRSVPPDNKKRYTERTVISPVRPFLYTLDQISSMLAIDERQLIAVYLFLDGRSTFPKAKHHLTARNIAPPDHEPDWRVIEAELIRWLKVLGYSFYSPAKMIE